MPAGGAEDFGLSSAIRTISPFYAPLEASRSLANMSGMAEIEIATGPKVHFKITYPNRKIYVGLDLTRTAMYFGSSSIKSEIAADLTSQQRRDLTIRKQIIWESTDATHAEARAMEVRLSGEV